MQSLQSRESDPDSSNQAYFLLNPLNTYVIVYLLSFLVIKKKSCRNNHCLPMNPYPALWGVYSHILVLHLRTHGRYPTTPFRHSPHTFIWHGKLVNWIFNSLSSSLTQILKNRSAILHFGTKKEFETLSSSCRRHLGPGICLQAGNAGTLVCHYCFAQFLTCIYF